MFLKIVRLFIKLTEQLGNLAYKMLVYRFPDKCQRYEIHKYKKSKEEARNTNRIPEMFLMKITEKQSRQAEKKFTKL